MVLVDVIRRNDVKYIVSELPHGSQNAMAAAALGMCAGAVQAIADTMDIGLEWYSEGDSKMALLNKRSATKGETITAIQKHLPWIPSGVAFRDEAVADALSVYVCARKNSSTIKLLTNADKFRN